MMKQHKIIPLPIELSVLLSYFIIFQILFTSAFTRYHHNNPARTKQLQSRLFESWSTAASTTSENVLINNENDETPSSPRVWLEQQLRNQSIYDDGAYTVLRGEMIRHSCDDETKISIQIWGRDYHLSRLQESYRLLFQDFDTENHATFNEANESSIYVLEQLAEHVVTNYRNDESSILMLTLLWMPSASDDAITVSGHVTLISNQNHVPCKTACISLKPLTKNQDSLDWPNRFSQIPAAKYVSWCLKRRPLEDLFSSNKIILLPSNDNKYVLEGITSNIFVHYKDGSWRTNMVDALRGYSQNIICKILEDKMSAQLQYGPISLQESDKWEHIFITSSVSWLQPIGKLLVPVYAEDINENNSTKIQISHYETLWELEDSFSPPEKVCEDIFLNLSDTNIVKLETQIIFSSSLN